MDIVDLRGRIPPAVPTPVLADPSGKRARRLARLGRAVALLFTLWLLGLLLAGLGILPAGLIPLGRSVGLQSLPTLPTLPSFPAPQPPSKSDLAAAKPLNSSAAGTTAAVHGSSATVAGGLIAGLPGAVLGQRGAPGHGNGHGVTSMPVKVGGKPVTPGASVGTGAGQGTNPPGQVVSQGSPGHTTTTPGNSGSAPGQIKPTSTTTSTSPGQSGSAPGQTRTHGTGGGHGY